MTNITEWFINLGIPESILVIIAFIPIIITITTISRYVTGIKTFGIYPPMVLAVSYFFLGIGRGLLLTFIVILASVTIRSLIKKVGLHYLSRLGVIYSGLSLALLLFFSIDAKLFPNNPIMNLATVSPLAMVMVISITDRFISNYIKRDLIAAVRLTLETVIIAVIGWVLLAWEPSYHFILNNLWLPILAIIINVIIGKYSGLRLVEMIRFNQVVENVEHPGSVQKKP